MWVLQEGWVGPLQYLEEQLARAAQASFSENSVRGVTGGPEELCENAEDQDVWAYEPPGAAFAGITSVWYFFLLYTLNTQCLVFGGIL